MSKPTIKCPQCRQTHTRADYLSHSEAGTLDQLCYRALCDRIDGQINEFKMMLHEAYRSKKKDDRWIWETQANIKNLERQKEALRKPNS